MRELSSRPRGLAVLVAAAFVALSFSALPLARAATDLPAWSVGDSWTYYEYGLIIPFPSSGSLTYRVTSTDSIVENGTSIATYHAELWANTTVLSPYHVADVWYRMSDLAVVRLSLNISACYPFPPSCSNTTLSSTMFPPFPLHFPLTAGDAWTASTFVAHEAVDRTTGSAVYYNGTGSANASVGADESVTVPAGTFTVSPLDENYTHSAISLSLSYGTIIYRDFSPRVGNAVLERDYFGYDLHTGMWSPHMVAELQLASYSYSPPWYDLRVLGLPVWSWLIVAAAVIVGVAFVALRRRRVRRAAAQHPSGSLPSVPPTNEGKPPPRP